jgi:hypothetical protein
MDIIAEKQNLTEEHIELSKIFVGRKTDCINAGNKKSF